MTHQPAVGDLYEYNHAPMKGKRIRLTRESGTGGQPWERSFTTVVTDHHNPKMLGYTSHVAAWRLFTSSFTYVPEESR